ncbi:MAG: DUF6542 domain-containing protein [Pseudonocardiaceae bacterium]
MTITRERPAVRRRGLRWDERSLLRRHAGVQWWLAVCLALAFTTVGAFADIQRINRLGIVFQACYLSGCLLAVTVVQRKGLFGPMVQPPLILALVVPSVVLLAGSVPSGGTTAAALAVGTPLLNGFPIMAVTTALTLALGAFRISTQRPPTAQNGSPQSLSDPERSGQPARAAMRRAREDDVEPLTEPILRVTAEVFSRFEKHPRRQH